MSIKTIKAKGIIKDLKVCPVCEKLSLEEYITSKGSYFCCLKCTFETVV